MHHPIRVLLTLMMVAGTVEGATVVLKDGSFVEGSVVFRGKTSIRVKTPFGPRTYKLRDVDQVIESDGESGSADTKKFSELPSAVKAVLNAETDYKLGNYEAALARIEPFRDYSENAAIRARMDWLFIEINERLARWDAARELLKSKVEKGSPKDKERAKAHLSIFDANQNYDLRVVGKKQAKVFLDDNKLYIRAKEPNSLKNEDVMRAALEEYCKQLLIEDTQSVKAFPKSLNLKDIYDASKKLPATGDVDSHMPYYKALQAAEAAIARAEGILGDYADAFKIDLLREELAALVQVFERLEEEVLSVSPAGYVPAFDPVSGRLTAQAGEEWRRRTDLFLTQIKPVARLLEYMKNKTELYDNELRDLKKAIEGTDERIQQMINEAKKNRDRSHV